MRTLRELTGWSLLLGVVLTPFVALGLLVLAVEEGWGFAVLGLLAMLAWPRMWLTARRLRQPPADEVAEADGRAPVVLLHRFSRVAEPSIARSLFVLPGLWRDLRDAWLERALTKSASRVGPVLSLARREPPPTHGPMSLTEDPEWERALDRHLRRASLAVIVLDGSLANCREIERARAIVGLASTALVVPAHLAPAHYEALRARVPLLPPYDPRGRVIRFDHEERAHLLRELHYRDDELAPAPSAPQSWLLIAGIPFVAGLLGAMTLPFLLEDFSIHLASEEWIAWGFATVFLGGALAVLSRRAFQLVPSSEAVMVTVAAAPWLVIELVSWIEAGDALPYLISSRLEAGALGAAYSAPLLAATAVVLASASLLRAAPGRRRAFAVLGAASLLPFAPLVLALDRVGAPTGLFVFSLFAAGVGLGMAAWAASGEPARAHAPLPIGAAVAAALSACAVCALVSHTTWRGWVTGGSDIPRTSDGLVELTTLGDAWPYFAWAGPAVIVLVSSQFAKRATRPAIASMVALLPLLLLTALAIGAEAAARSSLAPWMFE